MALWGTMRNLLPGLLCMACVGNPSVPLWCPLLWRVDAMSSFSSLMCFVVPGKLLACKWAHFVRRVACLLCMTCG